jgi:uncharacterized protein (TIGR00661 family)
VAEKINIKILVAPLDWGLGHATRCIPIINHLLQTGCKVIIAAEGSQEKLLKTEFPEAAFVFLQGYRIRYSSSERFFSFKIILQVPKIIFSIQKEKKWLKRFVLNNDIDAIISDNRYGLNLPRVTTVFMTHQLNIKAPFRVVENIIQRINFHLIEKFSECWVPDEMGRLNIAGSLSHPKKLLRVPVRYIGGLSRLEKQPVTIKMYDMLIIISGPEPQRTLLERRIVKELDHYQGKVLLIRGLPGKEEKLYVNENVTVKNHLAAEALERAFNESELIISRSGYTTVMDILKLKKKSVLIPTPGQTEQEYLAQHLATQGWCIVAKQDEFSLKELVRKAEGFHYKLPDFNMQLYKQVLQDFIEKLQQA